MYEKIAWENFLKTGDINSYMEYRRLMDIKQNVNAQMSDLDMKTNVGEIFNEIDKDQGDSYKRNTI